MSGFDNDATDIVSRGIQHPNPLFDFLTTFVPRRLKQLFIFCEYLYYNSPAIFAALNKFALYPVTDLIYRTDNPTLKGKYQKLMEKTLKLKTILIKTGIDRQLYGNSFISMFFPFRRYLNCPSCDSTENIKFIRYKFKLKGLQFRYTCPKCKKKVLGEVVDKRIRYAKGINIIRWDPKAIDIESNTITGDVNYYYTIPDEIRSRIRKGDRQLLDTIPMAFLETIAARKIFKFAPDQIFHMKADAPAGIDIHWGFPGLTAVLKQFFYVAVLRKANEAIALEHIVPFRVLHPKQISANADPVVTISMSNWVNEMKMNLKQWRRDSLHLMFSPVALDVTTLGGQGRALMVTGEIKEAEENIIAAMGIPREFLYGGLSATGSSVTLRMLENQLLNYTTELIDLAQWVLDKCGKYMGYRKIEVGLQPFKLIDDVQQKIALMQTNLQMGGTLVSRSSLAAMFGQDLDEEREKRMQEEIDEFNFQNEVQKKIQDLQSNMADKARAAAHAGAEPTYNPQEVVAQAEQIAQQLLMLDSGTKRSQLHSLQMEDPVMYAVVVQRLEENNTQQQAAAREQVRGEQGGAM